MSLGEDGTKLTCQAKSSNKVNLYGVYRLNDNVEMCRPLINNLLGDPEVTANLYCNFAYLYWEGYLICGIYLR